MTVGPGPDEHAAGADSAGRAWAGRSFASQPSPWAGDDGTTPAGYAAALAAFRRGDAGPEAVLEALRGVRLLVPLLARLGEVEEHDGRTVDKTAELALVTVGGPDGRPVLPAFSSAAAMRAWNPTARPIPAPARQVALGAAGDGTELVVVDPASPERFGLRRSALEALARDLPWTAPWRDPLVVAALGRAAADEPAVAAVQVSTDDPRASLDGAEVAVAVAVRSGLDRRSAGELVARLQRRWTEDEVIRARVDSMVVRLEAEPV